MDGTKQTVTTPGGRTISYLNFSSEYNLYIQYGINALINTDTHTYKHTLKQLVLAETQHYTSVFSSRNWHNCTL